MNVLLFLASDPNRFVLMYCKYVTNLLNIGNIYRRKKKKDVLLHICVTAMEVDPPSFVIRLPDILSNLVSCIHLSCMPQLIPKNIKALEQENWIINEAALIFIFHIK